MANYSDGNVLKRSIVHSFVRIFIMAIVHIRPRKLNFSVDSQSGFHTSPPTCEFIHPLVEVRDKFYVGCRPNQIR